MHGQLTKTTRIRLIAAVFVIMFALSGVFAFFEGRTYYQRRENHLYLAANQARLIEGSLDTVMARVYTLRALVKTEQGNIDFFEEEVPEIYSETADATGLFVKNFILAPDGIVSRIYPLEENEELLGLNYMDSTLAGNGEAMEAYEENKLIMTEPFDLKQGGRGIAGRLPVFIEENGQEKFWGMVSVTLDMDYLLGKFNLSYLKDSGTNYCLWYAGTSGEKMILAESAAAPSKPISYQIQSGNLNWVLDVAPENGWLPVPEILFGMVVILAITFLLAKVLDTRARMKVINALLEEIAIKDNLTGCYSRHYVNVMLLMPGTKEWKDSNANYSLAVIDVDYFKHINDTFGHDIGDAALVAIARELQKLCDELRGDCVIRYGGDEFIFLMNNIDRELFESRLKDIVENVRAIRVPQAPDMRLTVSVGAVMGDKNQTYFELFSRADKQVYISKESGKDQYHIE